MSKAHRGKGIRELIKSGRETCPVCKRSGIKVLYENSVEEKSIKSCKQCRAAIAKGNKKEVLEAIL